MSRIVLQEPADLLRTARIAAAIRVTGKTRQQALARMFIVRVGFNGSSSSIDIIVEPLALLIGHRSALVLRIDCMRACCRSGRASNSAGTRSLLVICCLALIVWKMIGINNYYDDGGGNLCPREPV